jgi:trypsin
MTISRRSFLLALPLATIARAIVIRDGVPDSSYLAPETEFPPLADLPVEGHGTLITKQWVVTAAHAVHEHHPGGVTINGKWRAVADTVVHSDFRMVSPPAEMRGDAAPLMRAFRQMHDIALLRLAAPVEDVRPAELYRRTDEQGKLVTLYGKGATGNGVTGEDPNSPQRGLLRRAHNRISGAERLWLTSVFDCGSSAPLLDGVIGSGDSGGPVLIEASGNQMLAGVTSWRSWDGDLKDYGRGVCGQTFYCSRISHYAEWIDHVTRGFEHPNLLRGGGTCSPSG